MQLFQWNSSYSVGFAEIDNQHKRWFQLAHELHSAVVTGKGREKLGQVLASFAAYTKGHFATEERLMLTHGARGLSGAQRSAWGAYAEGAPVAAGFRGRTGDDSPGIPAIS